MWPVVLTTNKPYATFIYDDEFPSEKQKCSGDQLVTINAFI